VPVSDHMTDGDVYEQAPASAGVHDRGNVGLSDGPSSACPAARREEEGDFEATLGRAWLRGTSLGKARGGLGRQGGVRRALARWSAGDVALRQ
jgi:hypothetical protein